MIGMQVWSDSRRIARCMAAAAQWQKLAIAGNTQEPKQSKMWCTSRSPVDQQDVSKQHDFPNTAEWWDNGWGKPSVLHPGSGDMESKVPVRRMNRWKPVWANSEQLTIDSGLTTTVETKCTTGTGPGSFAPTAGQTEIKMCMKLCEDGPMSDAVDALDLLVQRGCYVSKNLFYRALKRCIQNKDLALGRRIHALTVKGGYEGDGFLSTHLISFYASHRRLEDAMAVFTTVTTPDAYNWTTIIFAYARHGEAAEAAKAIRLYRRMCDSSTVKPDDRLYSAVLKACAVAKDVIAGREVHAHISASREKSDRFVQAGLIDMYAKCGSLEDARRLFDTLSHKDVVTWTSMIAGYAQQDMGQEAINLNKSMQKEGVTHPNSFTYACLLQACGSLGAGALHDGKQLHSEINARRLDNNVVLAVSLVHMYAKCGSLEDARRLFERLPGKDVLTWTILIVGYAQRGMGQEALRLYSALQQGGFTADSLTYVRLLHAFAGVGVSALYAGKQLHAHIQKRGLEENTIVSGSLVNMYAKCGSLEDARRVFDKLPEKNVVAWTAMIAGYSQQSMGQEALSLYSSMQEEGLTPDSVAYVCLLQACASIGVDAVHKGKQLHLQIEQQGLEDEVVLGGSLVNMYAKCGSLEDARRLFNKLREKNVFTWNAMFAGYVQQGMGQEALGLYTSMQQAGLTPDSVTYVCLLQSCASVGPDALHQGKQLHAQIHKQGLKVTAILGGSLVNMYAKCGSFEDGRKLFDKLSDKSISAWNAMIAGYAQEEMGQEAFNLYKSMQQQGYTPDSVTYVCLLQACAALAALPLGEQLHAEIKDRGMHADSNVGAALVSMYAKCGSMSDSQRVFDSLPDRKVEAWGALISGYARQGDSQVVFDLVDRMKLEGIRPNEILFLSVLTACSHVGLVEKGREYFEAMRAEYGISPNMEHFTCMVDLLGRAGHLHEALQMAKSMPFPPNDVLWHTLLGGCRKWKNVDIGEQAFKGAVSVDEKDSAAYVMMSNIYAGSQMWEAAKEMKVRRMNLGAWKKPGQSWWIDMKGMMHTFLVGDKNHPDREGAYGRLEQLIPKMKQEGYVPQSESPLLDIPDGEQQAELCIHSEILAVAYALSKTAEGTTIRIVKNLRVCEDCHVAIGYISKVEKRTIICRDARRFHVYEEGNCSCGGYW